MDSARFKGVKIVFSSLVLGETKEKMILFGEGAGMALCCGWAIIVS